jgi:large subunit ribosomal protein L10
MPTQKKLEVVDEYSQKFKDSKSIFLADYAGINVARTTELRRSFRKANVEYCILKNTLAKRSFKNAGIEGMDELLKGMTAFAFSATDAVAPIKVIKDFNKAQGKDKSTIVVKGCVFEGRIFGPEQVDVLSDLSTREVLLSQFVGMLQAPLAKLVGTLRGSGQQLVSILEQVKNQKS